MSQEQFTRLTVSSQKQSQTNINVNNASNQPTNNTGNTKHGNKRVTMIKHIVGKVRTTSYSLPDDHDPTFTYGIANPKDHENAGAVVQSWAQSLPPKQETIMSFPATNKKALKEGCLTSKSQRLFAKKSPVMLALNQRKCKTRSALKLEQKLENSTNNSHSLDQMYVYGIQSLKNDLPFKELLQSGISGDMQESDYPNLSKRQKRGRIPPSKVTRASRLLEASIKTGLGDGIQREGSGHGVLGSIKKDDAFKMKKFLKVESKVKAMLHA